MGRALGADTMPEGGTERGRENGNGSMERRREGKGKGRQERGERRGGKGRKERARVRARQ